MNEHWFMNGLLTVLLIASNVYWSRVVRELTAKLMSRNFTEYQQAKKLHKPTLPSAPPSDDQVDPVSERQAQELNSILGIA